MTRPLHICNALCGNGVHALLTYRDDDDLAAARRQLEAEIATSGMDVNVVDIRLAHEAPPVADYITMFPEIGEYWRRGRDEWEAAGYTVPILVFVRTMAPTHPAPPERGE